MLVMSAMAMPLRPSGKPGSDVAVDLDQRMEMIELRTRLERSGLAQHEDTDIGDLLSYIERLRIGVAHRFAQEDGPELAVEHQRLHGLLAAWVGAIDRVLQLVGGLEQRLRLDVAGRCSGRGDTRVGRSSRTRH